MATRLKSTLHNLPKGELASVPKRIVGVYTILLAAMAATSTMTGRAMAADNRIPAKGRAASASLYDWAGPYIGINAGYGFGKSQTNAFFSDAVMASPLFAARASSKFDGVIGGAQTGYNWQSGIWLIGLEADIAATKHQATKTYF
jgi:outer membrane immunogenic protein